MITLFSIPKAFTGPFARIQRNALGSWRALNPEIDIIVLGDEQGSAEAAQVAGVRHLPEVETTSAGTPRVDAAFAAAEHAARFDLLAYVNADIVLLPDFLAAVEVVAWRLPRFLMVGQRWDLDFEEEIDFGDSHWAEAMRRRAFELGRLHSPAGIDYFVFRRGLWREMPPFAVGRTAWDNWLVYSACAQHVSVVDATTSVTAVHQNHDYSHDQGGWQRVWKGPEAERNIALAGGEDHYFTLADASHALRAGRLMRSLDWPHFRRRVHTLPVLVPAFGWLRGLMRVTVSSVYRAGRQVARWRTRF